MTFLPQSLGSSRPCCAAGRQLFPSPRLVPSCPASPTLFSSVLFFLLLFSLLLFLVCRLILSFLLLVGGLVPRNLARDLHVDLHRITQPYGQRPIPPPLSPPLTLYSPSALLLQLKGNLKIADGIYPGCISLTFFPSPRGQPQNPALTKRRF